MTIIYSFSTWSYAGSISCHQLFSIYSEAQIQSELDALVVLKFQIDHREFETENQLKQAQEKLNNDLKKILNIDRKYLNILNQKINIHRLQMNIEARAKYKSDKETSERKQQEYIKITPEYHQKHMVFYDISPGTFLMGSLGKKVKVTISKPYAMMATPVTQLQWATLKIMIGEKDLKIINPSDLVLGDDSTNLNIDGTRVQMQPYHPVEKISWNDIQEFILGLNKLSNNGNLQTQIQLKKIIPDHKAGDIYDLPTEAQWEFIMRNRGNFNHEYYDRDDVLELPKYAWFGSHAHVGTYNVATKLPRLIDNGNGKHLPFYDLQGNVWEWMKDSWDGKNKFVAGSDPVGKVGKYRVLRGGSWTNDDVLLHTSHRGMNLPEYNDNDIGFRLIRIRP